MKKAGWYLLMAGGIGFIIGFFKPPTPVFDWLFGRVPYIGWLADRQNIFIFSWVLSIIGAIFMLKPQEEKNLPSINKVAMRKCPFCKEYVKNKAIICRFCKSKLSPKVVASPKTEDAKKNIDY